MRNLPRFGMKFAKQAAEKGTNKAHEITLGSMDSMDKISDLLIV